MMDVNNTHKRAGPEPPHRIPLVHSMKQTTPRVPETFTGSMKKKTTDALMIRRDDTREESRQRVRDLVKLFGGTVTSGAKTRGHSDCPNLPHGERMPRTRSSRRSSSGPGVIARAIKSIEAALPRSRSGSRAGSAAPSAASSRRTSISSSSRAPSIGPTPRVSIGGESFSSPVNENLATTAAEESTSDRETEDEGVQEDAAMHEFVINQLVEQLQAVQADKARAAEENARLQRENESLREMLSISMDYPAEDEVDDSVVEYIEQDSGVMEHIEEGDEEENEEEEVF